MDVRFIGAPFHEMIPRFDFAPHDWFIGYGKREEAHGRFDLKPLLSIRMIRLQTRLRVHRLGGGVSLKGDAYNLTAVREALPFSFSDAHCFPPPFCLSSHQQHFLCDGVTLQSKLIEIRSTSKATCIPLNLIFSWRSLFIYEHRHLLTEYIIDAKTNVL